MSITVIVKVVGCKEITRIEVFSILPSIIKFFGAYICVILKNYFLWNDIFYIKSMRSF